MTIPLEIPCRFCESPAVLSTDHFVCVECGKKTYVLTAGSANELESMGKSVADLMAILGNIKQRIVLYRQGRERAGFVDAIARMVGLDPPTVNRPPRIVAPEPALVRGLRERLAGWYDVDGAQYELGVCLGFFPEFDSGRVAFNGYKWVMWSANPLGDALHQMLKELVKAGVLEHDPEEERFRFTPGYTVECSL